MKSKFYAHGKFFEEMDDFFKFCHEWPDMQFDLDEFKHQMDLRIREAEMNFHCRDGKMTNREAYQLLRLASDWSVDKCIIQEVK